MSLSSSVMVNCTTNSTGTDIIYQNDRGISLNVVFITSGTRSTWRIMSGRDTIGSVRDGGLAKQVADHLLRCEHLKTALELRNEAKRVINSISQSKD